jgi:hypothetical protein
MNETSDTLILRQTMPCHGQAIELRVPAKVDVANGTATYASEWQIEKCLADGCDRWYATVNLSRHAITRRVLDTTNEGCAAAIAAIRETLAEQEEGSANARSHA